MRFESYIYLWLLCLIPLMTLVMAWGEYKRRKAMKRLGDLALVKALMPDASAKRRWTKFALLQAAVAAVIIMAARPQMGTKVSNEKRNGIETIICLDISNSMLAEDVKPSRLMKSKMLIENLVDHFSQDKVGLIVFAGDAFVQLPITSDYVSAKMFLQNIEPSLIQTQGTDIARALSLASNSFTKQKNIGKAIIVITDGEDHEGGAMEAAREAEKQGYKVFILGIGNTSGAPIPTGDGGYMKDYTGNTVMTALNEQMCRDIAAAGSGTYIHVDNTSTAQERLNDELAKLQKGEMKSVVYEEYDEQFQAFGLLALLLLVIEALTSEAVNPWLKKVTIFKPRAYVLILAMLTALPAVTTGAQAARQDRSFIRSGNRAMRANTPESPSRAELQYRKAMAANASNPQAVYNLGVALLAQQKDSMAMEMFQRSAQMEKDPTRKAMSYHNAGVIMQKHQQFAQAIELYKAALRLTPEDDETRYNLVLCQRQLKNQKQNQNNQGGGKDNKNNKDKNKDQNKDKEQDKKDDPNKKNQDKQDKQDQQDKQNQQKQPQQQMSKENAEQLLNAAMQDEKATQQRLKKAMSQPGRRNLQKNW